MFNYDITNIDGDTATRLVAHYHHHMAAQQLAQQQQYEAAVAAATAVALPQQDPCMGLVNRHMWTGAVPVVGLDLSMVPPPIYHHLYGHGAQQHYQQQ